MLVPVIMAGGTGTRLWPMSRALYPKQFLPLCGQFTMLQETVQRLSLVDSAEPLTVCNEEHRFVVAEQLRKVGQLGTIVLEPEGRNTAPTIALAADIAMHSVCQHEGGDAGDPLLLVLAADHVLRDEGAFAAAIEKAIPFAQAGKLVTFGIVPKLAHTGYGYIRRGESIGEAFTVDKFVEKPSRETAQKYLDSGDYFWNSGMFLFKASRYLEELRKHRPDIAKACKAALNGITKDLDFVRINQKEFLSCPEESVDYAVMEKTDDAIVVPLDAGWNDIGSWAALWENSDKDLHGNVVRGDCILNDTRNTLVHSEERLVVTVGIDDIVIVETKDAVMVAHRDKVQEIKQVVEQLKTENRSEWEHHREVSRPWGKYDSIDNGSRYQVKRITVNPGAKLSVQMHHHRAEHWIVVSGTAKVTNGNESFLVTENESTYIPVGAVHALENPGKVPLEMIEVQSGSYLGEDDIVRFDDLYGRVKG